MNELEIFILSYALMTWLYSTVFIEEYANELITLKQCIIKTITWPYQVVKALTGIGGRK